ncbi:MAG TPA: 3-oxoacyl-[acyl-carrier-protein] reductase [Dehalococcoidia bacterium]|nr:3-oxoacyl-[acyl-carrier-protein] reductase [Gemmatimonadota bacterium]HCU99901.1 3-oxoacyl-[acyl-carrier-protein] reductase [Dehalococcoidia bacterium]|tara:strand:+ start:4614 stop:5354 length:741 start_codon:yes stop_codon:yes gene_type:complete
MSGRLQGKVALVTGGARGIGLSIAKALAAADARVAVVDILADTAQAAAAELSGTGNQGFSCNVADPEAVQGALSSIEENVGPVDILINNAGITRDNLLMRMKNEDFDEVIAVNLKGAFNFTRAAARGMMKRRDGVIINIASVVGLIGNPGQTNYAASKAGLIGMTKSVARELASRGVRCNAVAPGFISTPMTDALSEDQKIALKGRIPLGTLGTPDDVASAVMFLVGPDARYITGQVLSVDGGMAM